MKLGRRQERFLKHIALSPDYGVGLHTAQVQRVRLTNPPLISSPDFGR